MKYRINFGYGLSPKWYTLTGAKIAATRFMRKTGLNWLTISEFKNGRPFDSFTYEAKK